MASKLRPDAERRLDEMLTNLCRVKELVAAQPVEEGSQERVRSDIVYNIFPSPSTPTT